MDAGSAADEPDTEPPLLLGNAEWVLSQLVEEIANAVRTRICRSVVVALHRLPPMPLTEDSGLRNVWEEIAAQVQFEQSTFWETAYLPTMRQFIRPAIEGLSRPEKRALWLQSDEGSDWLRIGIPTPIASS